MADAAALGARAWPAVGSPTLVVPVGSCEQHGPHLPLDTDTRIAVALAMHLAAGDPATFVLAPPLAVTASGEHAGFPGTLSLGVATTAAVLVELARSADWAAGVVYVNGHGGNTAALQRASSTLRSEGRRVLCWSPRIADGDLHAGHTETSLLLHLAPDVVDIAAAVAGPQPALAELVDHGVRALSPTGVLGDPTRASAEDGHRLFAELAEQLVRAVDAWRT